MSYESFSAPEVFLTGPDEWDQWDLLFKGKAKRANLWALIDPNDEDPPTELQEPTEPESEESRNIYNLRSGSINASSGSTATLSSEKSVAQAYTIYGHKVAAYERQRKAIDTLCNWVGRTVSPTLLNIACRDDASLRDWYAKLTEYAGMDAGERSSRARERYLRAVQPLTKPPKSLDAWLKAWEQAVAEGQRYNVAEALNHRSVFDDFTKAIYSIYPSWISSYILLKKDQATGKTLTYRIIAHDVRDTLMTKLPLKALGRSTVKGSFVTSAGHLEERLEHPDPQQPGIPGGSFGPSYGNWQQLVIDETSAEATVEEDAPRRGNSKSRGAPRGHGRGGGRVNKRPRPNTTGGSAKCGGCGIPGHEISECYYIHPKMAHASFVANPDILEKIYLRMEEDKEFSRLVTESRAKRRRIDAGPSS